MRDIEVIDGQLRLLLAIRQMVREEESRTPSIRPVTRRADRGKLDRDNDGIACES
jgi:hypothetical protein